MIDLAAHGHNQKPADKTITKMAETLLADHAITDETIVVGHSMGALIALEIATLQNINRLVLMGAGLTMSVHPDLLSLAKKSPREASALILKWGTMPDALEARTALALIMQDNQARLHDDLLACDLYQDAAEKAALVKCADILLLSGANDKMVKEEQRQALLVRLDYARSKDLPNLGHMMVHENPDDVAKAILKS
jgi:pimeloyl-ACP methyl ester carboxylesterase